MRRIDALFAGLLGLLSAVSLFAEEGNRAELYSSFRNPPRSARPWTYWLWSNTLTDRQTIVEDVSDIAKLGFGGVLLSDGRGYGDDVDHIVYPRASVRWGGETWFDLVSFAVRECARNGIGFSMNVAASGGHLRGDVDVGGDAPKFLLCREYLPGERLENPDIPNYHDIGLVAVKVGRGCRHAGWRYAGDGVVSMASLKGNRTDQNVPASRRSAIEVKELVSEEEGARLGAEWLVVRFGVGTVRGQEKDVDVLDRLAVWRHLDRVVTPIVARVPDLVGSNKTFSAIYNVSWEGALPTWCRTFENDFERMFGYRLRCRLPILAGFDLPWISTSDFMKDYRRCRGVLMRMYLYETVKDWGHAKGFLSSSESGGPWKRTPETFGECDQLDYLSANDIPQGEFWPISEKGTGSFCGHANENARFITKAVVSAARVWGCPFASAEAFTHMHRHWSVDPAFLKPVGDQAFADGINRFVWHTYTSSPQGYGVPGLEYFAGSHINRNVTWHDDFSPMVTYLSRCQSLLQQGTPVVDIAVLVGNRFYVGWGNKENQRFRSRVSEELDVFVPPGFDYDVVNDSALDEIPHLLSRYRIVYDVRKCGDGVVDVKGLLPDVETSANYSWCHRKIGVNDVYFIAGEGRANLTFRTVAERVELWDAVTGCRELPLSSRVSGGRTSVTVDLPVGGSRFVVFLRDGLRPGPFNQKPHALEAEVNGPWDVAFKYHAGVTASPPNGRTMSRLLDFTRDAELRHFSGAATYRNRFTLERIGTVKISLGNVPSGLAHVYVNGCDCGTAWCAPWEADVSKAVCVGENRLEIRYTNNWCNRMVGDCSLAATERVTRSLVRYCDFPREKKDPKKPWKWFPTVYSSYSSFDELQPSGLLGPVKVLFAETDVPDVSAGGMEDEK